MKKIKRLKNLAAALAAAALAVTAVLPAYADKNDALDGSENVNPDDGDYDVTENFPAKFDLRDVDGKCYVTPVRSQGHWGTCWGFSATAACEVSIIYELANTNGMEVDTTKDLLSPLHLAWFSHTPLPEGDEHYPSQIGEGGDYINIDGSDAQNTLGTGGTQFTAASVFSMGIGPNFEYLNPYKNHSGNIVNDEDGEPKYYETEGEDWSVDEEYRFYSAFELEDSNLLPSPAVITSDDNGNKVYTYNEEATNVIKSELMKGRGVAISYYADSPSFDTLSDDGKYISQDYAHYTYLPIGINHGVCIVGWDDNYSRDHFLQGTDNNGNNRTPPADGAWIVKNSWGAAQNEFPNHGSFGVDGDGYFYLSYYDQTILRPESFNFYTENYGTQEYFIIDQYDLMPADDVSGFLSTADVQMANVFEVAEDEHLRAVSVETALPDTEVTYRIYKLNENYTSPDDGELMATVTDTYAYAGYHRTNLETGIKFSKGDHYSIIATEKLEDYNVLMVKAATNKKNAEATLNNKEYIDMITSFGAKALSYSVGIINRGESFICAENEDGDLEWKDWVDAVEEEIKYLAPYGKYVGYYDFDNLPIKGYADPIADDGSEDDSSDSSSDSSEPEDSSSEPEDSSSEPDDSSSEPDDSSSGTDNSGTDNGGSNPNTGKAAGAFLIVIIIAAAAVVVSKKRK